jgi:hypothetical protein
LPVPQFSILVPHYDGVVSDAQLLRCLNSLAAQSLQDFEVRLYHDGPLSRPLPPLPRCGLGLEVVVAARRANDWGHSLRDRGIGEAGGDYIVHLNADNLLYPQALETLARAARLPVEPAPAPEMRDNPEVLVFAILMRGRRFNGRVGFWRDKGATHTGLIVTGVPPQSGFIDCMQVVARRQVWQALGGWYDRSEASDGLIYERLIAERGARYVPAVLGEHW